MDDVVHKKSKDDEGVPLLIAVCNPVLARLVLILIVVFSFLFPNFIVSKVALHCFFLYTKCQIFFKMLYDHTNIAISLNNIYKGVKKVSFVDPLALQRASVLVLLLFGLHVYYALNSLTGAVLDLILEVAIAILLTIADHYQKRFYMLLAIFISVLTFICVSFF